MEATRKFYKYRPIGGYTDDIFLNRRLYFAKPASFNDPFDCHLPLHAEGTESEWTKYANDVAQKYLKPDERDVAIKLVLDKKPWLDATMADKAVEPTRHKIYNESSVFCWSKKPNDILMFAYYAEGHKGICLEFTIDEPHQASRVARVGYEELWPDLSYLRHAGSDRLSNLLMFTKSVIWKHEEEVRAFRYGIPAGYVDFPERFLTGITFGVHTGVKERDTVKKLLAGWSTPVVFYGVRPSGNAFELKQYEEEKYKGG
jgi:hypothetical protein